jgi:hypothetical protein
MLRLYLESLISVKISFRNFLSRTLRLGESLFAQNLYFWGMSGGVMRSLVRSAIG